MRMTALAAVRPGDDTWPAWVPAPSRRRLDPLARICCAAVERILSSAILSDDIHSAGALPDDTAVVVASSYGAVESTFRFANSIAAYGDASASPTPFTTSVHNSCAGAIGEFLRLHGPTTTISQGATGTLAALRWGARLLMSGRVSAVLVVSGECHNAWSTGVVSALSRSPWPIGDGASACLLQSGDGPGREIRLGRHAAPVSLDSGSVIAADTDLLMHAAHGSRRICAPERIGAWWPSCLLHALDWSHPDAIQLRECEHGSLAEVWLGPER